MTGRTRKLISYVLTRIFDRHPMSRLHELLPFAYRKPTPARQWPDNDAYHYAGGQRAPVTPGSKVSSTMRTFSKDDPRRRCYGGYLTEFF